MSYTPPQVLGRLPNATDYVPYFHNYVSQSLAAGAGTANRAYYALWTAPYSTAITALSFYNVTGTNNHDLGIYGANLAALARRGSTASVAATEHVWTLTTPVPVIGGQNYWIAFATAGTATYLSMSALQSHGTIQGLAIQASALALPDPMVPAAYGTSSLNWPIIRITLAT